MTEIILVHPSDLKVNPTNIRSFDPNHEDNIRLRQSIKSSGILTPFQVYDDYTVFDGNSRLNNILYLSEEEGIEIKEIPIIVIARSEDEAKEIIRQLNVNQARQLSIPEQAVAFSKLNAAGFSNKQIADLTPFSLMHVGNVITFLTAPVEVKEAVEAKKLSPTLAIETLRAHGKDRGAEILNQAVLISESTGKSKATQTHVDAAIVKMELTKGFPKTSYNATAEQLTEQPPENVVVTLKQFVEETVNDNTPPVNKAPVSKSTKSVAQQSTNTPAHSIIQPIQKQQASLKDVKQLISEFFAPAEAFIKASEGEDGEEFLKESFAFVDTLHYFKQQLKDMSVI